MTKENLRESASRIGYAAFVWSLVVLVPLCFFAAGPAARPVVIILVVIWLALLAYRATKRYYDEDGALRPYWMANTILMKGRSDSFGIFMMAVFILSLYALFVKSDSYPLRPKWQDPVVGMTISFDGSPKRARPTQYLVVGVDPIKGTGGLLRGRLVEWRGEDRESAIVGPEITTGSKVSIHVCPSSLGEGHIAKVISSPR